MKIRIMKTCDFDAAHRLTFLPPEHKCHHLHGHTYHVEAEFEGDPDDHGMLVDYGDIAGVVNRLDHTYLNDVPGLENSTTENVVGWLVRALSSLTVSRCELMRVRVYESSSTWAEWHNHGDNQ